MRQPPSRTEVISLHRASRRV